MRYKADNWLRGGGLRELQSLARVPIRSVSMKIVARMDDINVHEEGCLSIPDYYAEVERPAGVTVTYLDRDGTPRTMEADGLMATCLQHEIDHLNGVLFIDHISRLKREMVVRRFKKLARDRPPNTMVG